MEALEGGFRFVVFALLRTDGSPPSIGEARISMAMEATMKPIPGLEGKKPVCRQCGAPGPLKVGWTQAQYCSESCERRAVSYLHGTMPGAGPLPYPGWIPHHISVEISRRWADEK